VGCGVALACFMHVYDAATMIGVTSHLQLDAEGNERTKIYNVHGVLFFGSAGAFLDLFDVEHDPLEVQIIFESSYIADFSALEALNKLGERYGELGKHVRLQLLHPGSSRIVDKAANLLVKELTLSGEGDRVLDSPRFRHNIEGYSQSFVVQGAETVMGQDASEELPQVRQRSVLTAESGPASEEGSSQ